MYEFLSVLYILLPVPVFQILSKTLTLVFLMQKFVLFSVQIWRQRCQHFYLPFCCQLSAFYLGSLWSSQELHKFSFCSDAYPKSILLSPPKVIKCFIKMQEPCKDWKWVGQDIQLSIPCKNRLLSTLPTLRCGNQGAPSAFSVSSRHSSCLGMWAMNSFPGAMQNTAWSSGF